MLVLAVVNNSEKFCVMVLDDDACLTRVIVEALHSALPNAQVLAARSVAEGQLLIAEYTIHFFILDIHLPDGNGIDFLCDLRMTCPNAGVVVVSAIPLPRYQEQSSELGVLLFREKPVDPKEIVNMVRQHANLHFQAAEPSSDTNFHVSLSRLSALDIIQLKCLTSATQALEVTNPSHGCGRIYFQKGEIIHAETATATGAAAFEEIIRWRGGRIVDLMGVQPPVRTISGSWQGILLDAAQRIDESRPQENHC